VKTIEEIMAAMTAVMDGAADRELTDDEVTQYEGLENELKAAQRTQNVRSRHAAYNVIRTPAGVPAAPAGQKPGDRTDLDRAFENYLRTGKENADISELYNAQGESGSASGGYLVPTTMRDRMIEKMKAFGGIAQFAETITTTTGEPIQWGTLDDTANMGGIAAESAAPASGADLVFGKSSIGAYRYTSAGAGSNLPLRVPRALVRDSAFDIEGLVARKLGERIGRKMAVHWATGTGVGEPQGLVAASLTADYDLNTADTVKYTDAVSTQDKLDAAYDEGSIWLMRKNTWSQWRLVVDTNGRPIIQDVSQGITDQPVRRLVGATVGISEQMPLLSSAGITFPMVYGNIARAYLIRYVGAPSILVNPYTRMANGEIEYTGEQWADGLVQERAAYVIVRNNT
jgi:HK97 family phage major capsid protein